MEKMRLERKKRILLIMEKMRRENRHYTAFYVRCFLAWEKEGAGVLSRMPTVSMNRGMHRRFMRVH